MISTGIFQKDIGHQAKKCPSTVDFARVKHTTVDLVRSKTSILLYLKAMYICKKWVPNCQYYLL